MNVKLISYEITSERDLSYRKLAEPSLIEKPRFLSILGPLDHQHRIPRVRQPPENILGEFGGQGGQFIIKTYVFVNDFGSCSFLKSI